MRRLVLALFTAFALLTTVTVTASASNHNCDDYVSQAAAQSVYDADTSDPKGLDGPPGPTSAGEPGVACETHDYANNPGTNPGLLGGGEDNGETDDGSDGGAAEDGSDDGAADDGETTELPETGVGSVATSSNSMLLVTALGGIAALLGLAALRVRDQS